MSLHQKPVIVPKGGVRSAVRDGNVWEMPNGHDGMGEHALLNDQLVCADTLPLIPVWMAVEGSSSSISHDYSLRQRRDGHGYGNGRELS